MESTNVGSRRMGLWGLVAIVFGSMIGSGIFNLAQNMAQSAGAGAVAISWVVTAVGMLTLVYTFKMLADARPDLDAGIYEYAQEGFGNYVGFNIAWGYWLCTAFANVTFAVMLNDSFGAFFPVLLEHGWPTVVFGCGFIWLMYFIVVMGFRGAAILNGLITAVKVTTLVVIGVMLVLYFRLDMFTSDFWGDAPTLESIVGQVGGTMLVTLWCFIGIEGAMMMSARAKRPCDVGRAGLIGFAFAWTLYAMFSLLCYGIMSQAEMSGLEDPSIAYVLRSVCGEWAYWFVIIAVIVSLMGSWVAWTLICAQVPMEVAKVRLLPREFLRLNRHGMPAYGLFWSSVIMSLFMVAVVTANSVYMAGLSVSGMMVLPAYFFSGVFLWKASLRPERYLRAKSPTWRCRCLAVGVLCTVNCAWLMYAGGLDLLLSTSVLYLIGMPFYTRARRQYAPEAGTFTGKECWVCVALAACAVASVVLQLV